MNSLGKKIALFKNYINNYIILDRALNNIFFHPTKNGRRHVYISVDIDQVRP